MRESDSESEEGFEARDLRERDSDSEEGFELKKETEARIGRDIRRK